MLERGETQRVSAELVPGNFMEEIGVDSQKIGFMRTEPVSLTFLSVVGSYQQVLPYQHGFPLFPSAFSGLPPTLLMPYDKHKQRVWVSKGMADASPYILLYLIVLILFDAKLCFLSLSTRSCTSFT